MDTVGVIGLGRMGLPIAQNLMDRGFPVVGFRRSGMDDFVAAGGRPASSPADVAAQATVLITVLPDAASLEGVVTGPNGTAGALRPGTVHIEMSTIDVACKRSIRDVLRTQGGDVLDAPISGSPGMVLPRLAKAFVSGEQSSVDRVEPVLDAISGPWVYTGEFGTGVHLKYVANLLLAVHTAAAAEAIVLARRGGLDLAMTLTALGPSIAGSAILAQRGQVMQRRAWTPAPGPIDTLVPVLEQIAAAAADLGLQAPVFEAARNLFARAMADGWGDLDIAAVHDQVSGEVPGQPD